MNDLAVVERGVGSFNDAKEHLQKALELRQMNLDKNDTRVASTCVNLASVLLDQANYSQAVVLLEQAAEIYRNNGDGEREPLSRALLNEARVFRSQGLLGKAAEYCQQAIEVMAKAAGPDSPALIDHYNTLAGLCIARSDFDTAAKHADRAWELCQRNHLENEPAAGDVLYQRARVELKQGKRSDAKRDWQAALKIEQDSHQPAQAARTLNYLALTNPSDAESKYSQALELQGSAEAHPAAFFISSCRLAEILYGKGQRDQAIDLVERAVGVLESPRVQSIGGEAERAEYFAEFSAAFDLLVKWNLEPAHLNVEKAFEFAEQGRNRTFLDQLSLVGVDLRDTLGGPNGESLRQRERKLRSEFATLQTEARAATTPEAAKALVEKLSAKQLEYSQVLGDIHNASSYYRERLSRARGLSSLQLLRPKLAQLDSVMLFYYVGNDSSYLLVIDPKDEHTEVVPLEIPGALAGAMKVTAGPITREKMAKIVAQYLADVRDRNGGRGLTGIIHSDAGVLASDQGTVLAEVLLPRHVRSMVEHRGPKCVVIVPDGALHELPFESLLVESNPARYLLDVFPFPIAYAPSANILVNLVERPAVNGKNTTALTLGNPNYPQTQAVAAVQRSIADATRAAYLGLGGGLQPLTATADECKRIASVLGTTPLLAEKATERNFRDHVAGCRFIHVAAHGLVDQQNENLFGAIALTPPAKPTDSSRRWVFVGQ